MNNKFEQYKMFAESAEKNSDKRIAQNNIYMTLNLAFLSYILFCDLDKVKLFIACGIGIFISIIWFLTIRNYSLRNKVKYQIINEMEDEFGSLYKEEWKRINILTSLSTFEKIISIVFCIIYIVIMVLF